MSDFLDRMADWALGTANLVQPVIPSRYAPALVEPSFAGPFEADVLAALDMQAADLQPSVAAREEDDERTELSGTASTSRWPIRMTAATQSDGSQPDRSAGRNREQHPTATAPTGANTNPLAARTPAPDQTVPTRYEGVEQPEAQIPTGVSTSPIPPAPVRDKPQGPTGTFAVGDVHEALLSPQTNIASNSRITAASPSVVRANIQHRDSGEPEHWSLISRQSESFHDAILPRKDSARSAESDVPQAGIVDSTVPIEAAGQRPLRRGTVAAENATHARPLPQAENQLAASRGEQDVVLKADDTIKQEVALPVSATRSEHRLGRETHRNGQQWIQDDGALPPAPPEKLVHVTIGRIEVRAAQPSVPVPRTSRAKSQGLSLEAYLNRYRTKS